MSRPKVILHLITGLEVGGAETMLLKILPRTQTGIEHHVCSIISAGPIGDKLMAAGIKVHHLDLNHPLDFTVIFKLRRLISSINPDVLITYLPHADLLGRIIGKLSGIPTIVGSIRVRLTKSKYLPYFIVDGLSSSLVNHYHFNSQTIADIHHRVLRVPDRKITVIPNAIDPQKYQLHLDVVKKKRELGLPLDQIIIGCVARLRAQKGHKHLVSAFQLVKQRSPKTTLVLVGDGEEKDAIQKQILAHNLQPSIILLGNRHDVPEILQTFDIFAFTTLYEGMSNSLMEAMAASRAIVTTDIQENKELLTNNHTGVLVPVKRPDLTADALVSLINDPARRSFLAHNACQVVNEKFSFDAIVPRYRDFYLSL